MKENGKVAEEQMQLDRAGITMAETRLIRASKFTKKFRIHEILNDDEERASLFMVYFARYFILKESYVELPLIEKIIMGTETHSMLANKAVEFLDEAAIGLADKIKKNDLINPSESREMSLFQLESAANFMSNAVMEHRKDKSINLEQKIEGIKERYKTV